MQSDYAEIFQESLYDNQVPPSEIASRIVDFYAFFLFKLHIGPAVTPKRYRVTNLRSRSRVIRYFICERVAFSKNWISLSRWKDLRSLFRAKCRTLRLIYARSIILRSNNTRCKLNKKRNSNYSATCCINLPLKTKPSHVQLTQVSQHASISCLAIYKLSCLLPRILISTIRNLPVCKMKLILSKITVLSRIDHRVTFILALVLHSLAHFLHRVYEHFALLYYHEYTIVTFCGTMRREISC